MSRWLNGLDAAAVSADVTPSRSHAVATWAAAYTWRPHDGGAGWSWAFVFEISGDVYRPLSGEELGALHGIRAAFEEALWSAFTAKKPGAAALTEAFEAATAAGQRVVHTGPHARRLGQLGCDIAAITVTGSRADLGWIGESAVRLLRPDGHWTLGSRPHTLANESPVPLEPGLYDNIITRRLLHGEQGPSFAEVELEQVRGVALTSARWPKVEGPWETGPIHAVAASWLQAALADKPLHPMGVALLSPTGR